MREARYFYVRTLAVAELAERCSALLISRGATGIELRDGTTMTAAEAEGKVEMIAWFASDAEAEATAGVIRGESDLSEVLVEVGAAEDPGWAEAWREYFRPMRFGRRLWVTPPDELPPADDLGGAAAILRLLPSGAFGTGTHETTALVLELLDELIHPDRPRVSVLDVGCGSGILAMASLLLGARAARGIDVDDDAVAAARENAESNRLFSDDDGRGCRFDSTPLSELTESYDMVLANLSAPVLVEVKTLLARRVAPGGWLIWSGLLESDLDDLGTPPGLALVHDRRRNGWVAQAWRRERRSSP